MNYEFNLRITVDCTDRLEKVLTALTGSSNTHAVQNNNLVTGEMPMDEGAVAPEEPQVPKKPRRTAPKKAEEHVAVDTNEMRAEEAPAPEEASVDKKEIKMEDLRPAMAKLWGSGNKEMTAQILAKHGAKLLKDVKPEEYGTLLNEFNEALHATA